MSVLSALSVVLCAVISVVLCGVVSVESVVLCGNEAIAVTVAFLLFFVSLFTQLFIPRFIPASACLSRLLLADDRFCVDNHFSWQQPAALAHSKVEPHFCLVDGQLITLNALAQLGQPD